MTRDEVIALARQAWDRDDDLWLTHEQYFLERFAALVVAAEREACAKAAEGAIAAHRPDAYNQACVDIAAAIDAARSKQ